MVSACFSMAQTVGVAGPIKILVITGGHPYDEDAFAEVFRSMKSVSFTHATLGGEAEKQLKPEGAKKYDVLVFYDMYEHCEAYLNDLHLLMEEGKGVVFLHHALGSCDANPEYGYLVGGRARFDSEDSKATLSQFKADTSYRAHIEDPDNPITAGMGDFDVTDEVYSNYFVDTDSHVFLTTDNPNSGRQLAWTSQYKKSRVVYIQLGHNHVTYENPNYRRLVERSILWVSGRLTTPTAAKISPGERPDEGAQLYAGLGCAACHGGDARGGRGPDLRSQALWSRSDAQQHVFDTIKGGVKGTEMPSFARQATEQDIGNLVSFLESLDARAPIAGDANHGREVFQSAGCVACHGPAGRGGVLGPELASVVRSKGLDYLTGAIRQPAKTVPFNYAAVSVVTQDGERITGRRCNEDTFSLQMVDHSGSLRMFMKDELQKLVHEQKSLMPTYDENQLSPQALLDTLAYLQSLYDRPSL
ncbi:MAG: ThuA domain-containing protein [Terriglobales bacterium]